MRKITWSDKIRWLYDSIKYELQDRVLEEIEALGDIPPHMGPQQGGNVTWDGGGSPAAVIVSSLRDQLGVFEGYSDNDDFNWSLISNVRPQAHAESPEHSPAHSPPKGGRHIPQTDGAGDESLSADSVSGLDLPDLDSQDANEADSQTRPRRHAGPADAGQQRLASAGSQNTQGGSQRFGGLAFQAASPSFKSAPEPDRFEEHSPNGESADPSTLLCCQRVAYALHQKSVLVTDS